MPLTMKRRRAFTLIELTVVIVLLAIVGVAVTATLARQGRASRAATELTELRDHLSEGASILASDLRSISLAGGDVYPGAMGKNSIEFRSAYGSSVVCEINGGSSITLPPNSGGTAGVRLSWLYKRADPGHGLFVFDEGATDDPSDDSWIYRIISAVATNAAACSATPFAGATSGATSGLSIALNAALPATVSTGAPVRFVERVRYALYQSSDGRWYLGYCASNSMSAPCATLQPVSGPYLPPNSNQSSGQSGLDLYYFDEDGVATSDPLRVARIEIALRGATPGTATLAGNIADVQIRDTVRLSVEVRNR